jgi:hypothetical protein
MAACARCTSTGTEYCGGCRKLYCIPHYFEGGSGQRCASCSRGPSTERPSPSSKPPASASWLPSAAEAKQMMDRNAYYSELAKNNLKEYEIQTRLNCARDGVPLTCSKCRVPNKYDATWCSGCGVEIYGWHYEKYGRGGSTNPANETSLPSQQPSRGANAQDRCPACGGRDMKAWSGNLNPKTRKIHYGCDRCA